MFQAFRKFLSDVSEGGKHPSRFEPNDYRLAAAALLVMSNAFNLIELVGGENDSRCRYAPADGAGTSAGNCDWRPIASRGAQNLGDVFGSFRKDYALGMTRLHVTGVGKVGLNFVWLGFNKHEVKLV